MAEGMLQNPQYQNMMQNMFGGHESRCYASRHGNGPTNDARKPRASRGDASHDGRHDGRRTSRTTAVICSKSFVIGQKYNSKKSTKNRPFPLQRENKKTTT